MYNNIIKEKAGKYLHMQTGENYYQLLNITETASHQEIKSAFRKLALRHHPDKNRNSPESASYFKVLLNAYEVLTDKDRRKQYDTFLQARRGQDKKSAQSAAAAPPQPENTIQTMYNQLNMFLWDIEDFLRELDPVILFEEFSGTPLWVYMEKLLKYIDKWTFDHRQFEDHVFPVQSRSKLALLNYFYNIRVRADKYFKELTFDDLVRLVPGLNIMKIDIFFEVFKHTTYYLTNIRLLLSGEIFRIPDYPYRELSLV
jgi:curved DNA-binding protein CbpA